MARVRDFRKSRFVEASAERCGHYVADQAYWKLYVIENTLRVVINSVLSIQVGPNWWSTVLDPKKARSIQQFRASYTSRPKHASPGTHDIYLTFLSDLNKIIQLQSDKFRSVIPDVDRWILRLEAIRLPRNLVGHMNFPNYYDRDKINTVYSRLPALLEQLRTKRIPIQVP